MTRYKPKIQEEKYTKELRFCIGVERNNNTSFLPSLSVEEIKELIELVSLL